MLEAAPGASGTTQASLAGVFAAAERGDLRLASATLGDGDGRLQAATDQTDVAWRLALRALLWSFAPETAARPVPEHARAFLGRALDVRRIAARACAVMERACVVTFDAPALQAWRAVHRELLGELREDPAVLELRAADLWDADLGGRAPTRGEAEALFATASSRKAAAVVLEAMILRARAAAVEGSDADARDSARRAMRMAQAEGLPLHEYLAALTLARVRREAGAPNQALHVLNGLAAVAPASWLGWIAWEMLLAGAEERALALMTVDRDSPASTPSAVAARALGELLVAARSGDRGAFTARLERLEGLVSALRPLAAELRTIAACLDGQNAADDEATVAWIDGTRANVPRGLHGLGFAPGADHLEAETTPALVVAWPGRPGRRVLRTGLPLLGPVRLVVTDTSTGPPALRTETGLAALALAGPAGLPRHEFFRVVYGFAFAPLRHQGVLDTLVMRMRARVADLAEIARDDGAQRLALHVKQPLAIPDVRCALPMGDRVLRAVVALGTASAQQAAETLRMPLRTVQRALQQLVTHGLCTAKRGGNQVTYNVVDTTFTEITRPVWTER